jgi:hypothetical protein
VLPAPCELARVEILLTEFADCAAREGCAIVAVGHEPPGCEVVGAGEGYLLVREAARL